MMLSTRRHSFASESVGDRKTTARVKLASSHGFKGTAAPSTRRRNGRLHTPAHGECCRPIATLPCKTKCAQHCNRQSGYYRSAPATFSAAPRVEFRRHSPGSCQSATRASYRLGEFLTCADGTSRTVPHARRFGRAPHVADRFLDLHLVGQLANDLAGPRLFASRISTRHLLGPTPSHGTYSLRA